MTAGRLMHGIHAHARFDDLHIDAKLQWVGKGKTPALNSLGNYKQAIHITLATMGGRFFLRDLDFENGIWLDHLVIIFGRGRAWEGVGLACGERAVGGVIRPCTNH